MAIWSLGVLVASLVFLAYKNPTDVQNLLPQWLWRRPATGIRGISATDTKPQIEKEELILDADEGAAVANSPEKDATPKASASRANGTVPSFSLSDDGDKETTTPVSKSSVPSFPAANSPQRASAMPPPPQPAPASQQRSPSSLMPPPARPTPSSRGLAPTQAASLRVPTTGPLPNRGPPTNSQQRVSSSLAPNAAVSTSDSRGKVLLKPGHSPMDWAALTRSPSSNLSGVSTFQRVTPSELRKMTGRKGKPAWSSWQGKVYNITPYVDFHPGGGPEIMRCAGRDGEKLFMETHPWVNWENMLGTCLVGVMVPEGYHDGKGNSGESELEGLD